MSRHVVKSHRINAIKALAQDDDGIPNRFEAVVAVFNNVDLHNDRIVPGAFAGSLDAWRAAGDPIPVIFSHQWADIDAHIGGVSPDNARELAPGDPNLPPELADLGGLSVVMDIDTTEDGGRKVAKLLDSRRIREFSFAYDVGEEERATDGINELKALDVLEVGPTLKGANPDTVLVGAKAGDLAATLASSATLAALSDIGINVGAVANALAGELVKADEDRHELKAIVSLDGTIERDLDAIAGAVLGWARELFDLDLYTAYVEATFSDRTIFYVELWDEPLGGGTYYEADYTITDGTVELGEPAAVDLVAEVRPKAALAGFLGGAFRRKAGARNAAADLVRIQSIHDLTHDLGATHDDEPDGTADDDADEEDAAASTASAMLAIELAELELTDG